MGKLDKIEESADRIAKIISCTAFSAMVIFITANVISRYLFNRSFNWAEEVAYLCFNWAVFFGVTIVYRKQGLTAIDIFVDRMKGKFKRAVLLSGYSLVVLVNLGLVIWGTKFSWSAWARLSPALEIPYFYFDVSIPLAAILLLGYSLKFAIKVFKGEELTSAAFEERS